MAPDDGFVERVAGGDGLECGRELRVEFHVGPVRFWGDEEWDAAGFCRAVELEELGGGELSGYPFAC